MGFGPTGYVENGTFKPFEEMTNTEKSAYQAKVNDILKQLRTPREANDTGLRQYLLQASGHGILFSPDGKALSQADVAKMSENPKEMQTFVTDLIVVEPNLEDAKKNVYRSLQATNKNISINWSAPQGLLPNDLRERQRTYLEKKQFFTQREKLSAMNESDRAKYLEDMKTMFAKGNADGLEVGNQSLKEYLEAAAEMGIVREVSGSTLTKETAAKFAERPAYLKNLVFIQPSEKDANTFDSYRLDISDSHPQTVKMNPTKLTPADIIQMDKDMVARGPREKIPRDFAMVLFSNSPNEIDKYKQKMDDFGYKYELIDGMQAFRLTDENQVYFFGQEKPVSSPDELIRSVRNTDAPKEPNSWGFFEGIRKAWHSIFHNVADYVEYEKEQALYELDKYHLAEKAGFDVSGMTAKKNEYESKYGDLYNQYQDVNKYRAERAAQKWGAEVDKWATVFDTHPMDEDEKTFVNDFKAAMKQYPRIGAQVMKQFSKINQDTLENILFVSQTYADLKRAGDYDREKLGALSALGVAAECNLLSYDTKQRVIAECKVLNKNFGSSYDQRALSDAEKEKTMTDVESGKSAVELKAEEEQKAAESNTAGKVTSISDAQAAGDKLRSTIEEEKAALADKIDGLTAGEKHTLEKLAKQYDLDLDNLDVNQSVSENTVENTTTDPQMNV